jgi:hypothetical protein
MGNLVITASIDALNKSRTKTYSIPDQHIARVHNSFKYKVVTGSDGTQVVQELSDGEAFDAWIVWILELTDSRVRAIEEQEILKTIVPLDITDQSPPDPA